MNAVAYISSRLLIYVLAGAIAVLAVYTVVGERGAIHLWRLQGEKGKLDEQNYRLHKENEALRLRILRLRTDDAYLEKVAREELNLVRPGEVIYRFSTDPKNSRSRAAQEPPRKAQPQKPQG